MQPLCPNQIIPTTCDDGRISLWPAMLRNLISGSKKCRWIEHRKETKWSCCFLIWTPCVIHVKWTNNSSWAETTTEEAEHFLDQKRYINGNYADKCSFCDFLQSHLSSGVDVTLARTTPWSDVFLEENNSVSPALCLGMQHQQCGNNGGLVMIKGSTEPLVSSLAISSRGAAGTYGCGWMREERRRSRVEC